MNRQEILSIINSNITKIEKETAKLIQMIIDLGIDITFSENSEIHKADIKAQLNVIKKILNMEADDKTLLKILSELYFEEAKHALYSAH